MSLPLYPTLRVTSSSPLPRSPYHLIPTTQANSQIANAQVIGQDSTTFVTHQMQNDEALETAWRQFWTDQAVHTQLATQQLGKVVTNPATWWAGAPGGPWLARFGYY